MRDIVSSARKHAADTDDVEFVADSEEDDFIQGVGRILLPSSTFSESLTSISQVSSDTDRADDARRITNPSMVASRQDDAEIETPTSQEDVAVGGPILPAWTRSEPSSQVSTAIESPQNSWAPIAVPAAHLDSQETIPLITHSLDPQASVIIAQSPPPRPTHDQSERSPSSSPPLAPLQMPSKGAAPLSTSDVPTIPSTPPPQPTLQARANPSSDSDEAAARAAAALPPTPPQRQLRTRKAQQLNPYTLEAVRYQRSLIRNDWQDAVVSQREWHRQERRRIAEEEARSKHASGSNVQLDSQSQWLVDSSGPSSDADPEDNIPEPTQSLQDVRKERSILPRTPIRDRSASRFSSSASRTEMNEAARASSVAVSSIDRNRTYKSAASNSRRALLGSESDSDSHSVVVQRNKRASPSTATPAASNIPFAADDSSDDERPAPVPPPKSKPRRSRWSGDGDSEDSTDYERRFRQLKKMMPAGMARKHIRDLRAMRHGKRYHSDGHVSSASSTRSDGSATVGDVTMTSLRATTGETPTTSPQDATGELRPGQTRKRLRRHNSLDGHDALLVDTQSESSDSTASSAADEVEVADRPDSDSDQEQEGWWTAAHYTIHNADREQDAIDRMLSRTTGGRRRPRGSAARTKSARRSRQVRLDGFVSSAHSVWDRPFIDKDSTGRTARSGPRAEQSVSRSTKGSTTKKRKADPRIGQTKRQYLGPSVLGANPPVVRPRTRPRLDLQHDEVLFARNADEKPGMADDEPSKDLALLVQHDETAAVAPVQARLLQPRKVTGPGRQNGQLGVQQASADSAGIQPIAHSHPATWRPESPHAKAPQVTERSTKRDLDIHPDAEQWDDFSGIRMDFGIRKPTQGFSLAGSVPLFRDGYLQDLVALPDNLIQDGPIQVAWSGEVLRLDNVILSMDMEPKSMIASFAVFCDRLRSEISAAVDVIASADSVDIASRRVQTILSDTRVFLCSWLVQQYLHDAIHAPVNTFWSYRALLSRIDTLQTSLLTSVPSARLKDASLQLCWLKFELCWRTLAVSDTHPSNALETEAPTIDELLMFSRTVMSLLLYHGLHKNIRSLRSTAARSGEEDGRADELTDATARDQSTFMWIGLIHLLSSFERSRGIVDGTLFWSQFELAFDKWDQTLASKEAFIRAERLWYCVFGITALSYFSDTGICQHTSHLRQSWSLVVKALACIRLRLEEAVEARMSWNSLAKRDTYVRVLLQRCCSLAVDWSWDMNGSDAALARLFDIFNSHKLSDLPSESDHDFAGFLRDFDISRLDLCDYRSEEADRESCYQLFVKLLARAGLESRALTKDDREGDRRVSKLFSRMTPVRVMPFTRTNVPTSSERSVLFNHYTVVMLFLHLVPSSSSQRLRQIQSFLPSFNSADFVSQVTCIRAMMYVAVLFRHHCLDVAPVTKWFGETMTALLQEHNELERSTRLYDRQKLAQEGGIDSDRMAPVFANSPARQVSLQRQNEVTRLLVTALRSIQHVIRHSDLNGDMVATQTRLPDLHLLHHSWTKHLLEAQLAIKPMIGQEALKCIQTFLLARIAAFSRPRPSLPKGGKEESQDSFAELFEADDDFDFEDPLLAQLLDGQVASAAVPSPSSDATLDTAQRREWDRQFSQLVKEVISPSLFHLLSNIYHPDRRGAQNTSLDDFTLGATERITDQRFGSAPGGARNRMATLLKVAERRKYLELVVDCWAGCGHVLVSNGLRDWSSYFGFGNESWKRIDDPIGRRDVGLRFLQNVLSLDPTTASVREYESEYIVVWIQTAAARVLSVQDVFTNSLRDTKHSGAMLRDLTARWKLALQAAQPDGVLDLENFPHVRRALLDTTFAWLVKISGSTGSASTVFSAISALLASLRVYIQDTPQPSRNTSDDATTVYLDFCRDTLDDLHRHIHVSPVFTSLQHEYENTLTVLTKRTGTRPPAHN